MISSIIVIAIVIVIAKTAFSHVIHVDDEIRFHNFHLVFLSPPPIFSCLLLYLSGTMQAAVTHPGEGVLLVV